MGNKRLEGKVALVSGAGQRGDIIGTGRASAILFAQAGARVFLVDWNEESAAETKAMIEADGGTAFVRQADVTKDSDCKTVVDSCKEKFGSLDILLNNVGGPGGGDVTEVTDNLWNESLDRNLKSAAFMSKYAVPAMADSGGVLSFTCLPSTVTEQERVKMFLTLLRRPALFNSRGLWQYITDGKIFG